MILEKVRVLFLRMAGNLVNALAEFGILVRQKICFDTRVRHLPVLAAIRRLINAARRDRDLDIIWILSVRDDRVQAKPAKTGSPFLSMRVFPKSAVQLPSLSAVM